YTEGNRWYDSDNMLTINALEDILQEAYGEFDLDFGVDEALEERLESAVYSGPTSGREVSLSPGGIGNTEWESVESLELGPGQTLEIESGGTGGGEFDRFEVTGDAPVLDGRLRISLADGVTMSPGDELQVIAFDLSGVSPPSSAELRIKLGTVIDSEQAFTVERRDEGYFLVVTETSTVGALVLNEIREAAEEVEVVVEALQDVGLLGDQLNGLSSGEGAEPADDGLAASDSIGVLTEAGEVFAAVLVDPVLSLVAESFQTDLIQAIEDLDGTTTAGFDISIYGVEGFYDESAFSFFLAFGGEKLGTVELDAGAETPGGLTFAGAEVDVVAQIEAEIGFGIDEASGESFLQIDNLVLGLALDVEELGVDLTFDQFADLEARVVAQLAAEVEVTPQSGIQTAEGRILRSTLEKLADGSLSLSDSVEISGAGEFEATILLDTTISGFGDFTLDGEAEITMSGGVFTEEDLQVLIATAGSMTVFEQELEGSFLFERTEGTDIVRAEVSRLELSAEGERFAAFAGGGALTMNSEGLTGDFNVSLI
ncbi:MAG: hypothetical protein MK312_14240, partial [Roseibacillus sp.]|nr:hypothetical protein [Roseibacillus sp.]